MPYYTRFATPLCEILLVGSSSGVRYLHLYNGEGSAPPPPSPHWEANPGPLAEAQEQIEAYLAGERTSFSLSLAPKGTPFQLRVWEAVSTIPYGETRSYGEIASTMGAPRAARAVGMAVSLNPLPLLIPCHRVIGSDGSLTGFAPGLTLKRALLTLETP